MEWQVKIALMCISVLVLNLGVICLLRVALRKVDIKAVLREKDSDSQPNAKTVAAGGPALDNTSYSRLSGFIGSVVLACFLWAISNYVLYASFYDTNTDDISKFLGSLGTYFLAGASLFAPYAFNKLSSVFKPG
ncbi:MAG: hypothetical protein ABR863_01355 [Roseiarcus sp.]|jgi:hypothetical protein